MDTQIASQVEPIQWVSLVLITLTLIVLIMQVIQHKKIENRLWVVPMAVWMLHSLLFYVVLMFDRVMVLPLDVSYTSWSSVLRLHGYFTIFAYEATRWYLGRINGKPNA